VNRLLVVEFVLCSAANAADSGPDAARGTLMFDRRSYDDGSEPVMSDRRILYITSRWPGVSASGTQQRLSQIGRLLQRLRAVRLVVVGPVADAYAGGTDGTGVPRHFFHRRQAFRPGRRDRPVSP